MVPRLQVHAQAPRHSPAVLRGRGRGRDEWLGAGPEYAVRDVVALGDDRHRRTEVWRAAAAEARRRAEAETEQADGGGEVLAQGRRGQAGGEEVGLEDAEEVLEVVGIADLPGRKPRGERGEGAGVGMQVGGVGRIERGAAALRRASSSGRTLPSWVAEAQGGLPCPCCESATAGARRSAQPDPALRYKSGWGRALSPLPPRRGRLPSLRPPSLCSP